MNFLHFLPQFLAVFGFDDVVYIALLVTSLAGAGISAVSQVQAANREAEAQEAAAKNQANAAQAEAAAAAENASRQREANRRKQGFLRAQIAAGNIQASGSALDVLGQNASELELGVLDSLNAAENRRRNYELQSQQSLFGASQSQAAGGWAATGTLLSGFARAGNMYASSPYAQSGGGSDIYTGMGSGVDASSGHSTSDSYVFRVKG